MADAHIGLLMADIEEKSCIIIILEEIQACIYHTALYPSSSTGLKINTTFPKRGSADIGIGQLILK